MFWLAKQSVSYFYSLQIEEAIKDGFEILKMHPLTKEELFIKV